MNEFVISGGRVCAVNAPTKVLSRDEKNAIEQEVYYQEYEKYANKSYGFALPQEEK